MEKLISQISSALSDGTLSFNELVFLAIAIFSVAFTLAKIAFTGKHKDDHLRQLITDKASFLGRAGDIYFNSIDGMLRWLAARAGDRESYPNSSTFAPWSAGLYDFTLKLALIYPLLFLWLSWLWTGSVSTGVFTFLSGGMSGALRLLVTIEMLVIVYAFFRFFQTKNTHSFNNTHSFWWEFLILLLLGALPLFCASFLVLVSTVVATAFSDVFHRAYMLSLIIPFCLYMFFLDHLSETLENTITFVVFVAYVVAISVIVVIAFVVSDAVTISAALSATFSDIFSGFSSSLAAFSGFFSLLPDAFYDAFSVAVAVTVATLFAYRYASDEDKTGFFHLSFWVLMMGLIISLYFVLSSEMLLREGSLLLKLLIFLTLLPLVNAPLDWLSLGLTRKLLAMGLQSRRAGQIFLISLFDLFAAFALILPLAGFTAAIIGIMNWVFMAGGSEQPLLAMTEILNNLDANPGDSRYTWIWLMLFSTLLPSLTHILAGITGLVVACLLSFASITDRVKKFVETFNDENHSDDHLLKYGYPTCAAGIVTILVISLLIIIYHGIPGVNTFFHWLALQAWIIAMGITHMLSSWSGYVL